MAYYKQKLLNHLRHILPALERAGAEASLNARNFHLEVRAAGKTYTLCPQFLKFENGARQYTPFFDFQVARFIGWLPYFNKRWDLSSEKLKFKEYAAANNIRTPEYSPDPRADMRDVLVKRSVSSFSEDIKGPFRTSKECELDASAGEFYERFVDGRTAKVYFLESRPVCLEFENPATVIGDGRSTIKELLEARAGKKKQQAKIRKIVGYLRYLGKSLHDVVEFGAVQQIDFKYGSVFGTAADLENVDLVENMIPELEPQLKAIGESLWRGIPADVRGGAVYTVDAIMDSEKRLWLTEMNSNPAIHPFIYPAMLEALFAGERAPQFQLPQRIAAATPEPVAEILQLAITQFTSGAVAQAQSLWDRVLKTQPTHPTALFYSGLAWARSGNLIDAKRALDLLVKTAPAENLYFASAKELLASVDGALHNATRSSH